MMLHAFFLAYNASSKIITNRKENTNFPFVKSFESIVLYVTSIEIPLEGTINLNLFSECLLVFLVYIVNVIWYYINLFFNDVEAHRKNDKTYILIAWTNTSLICWDLLFV